MRKPSDPAEAKKRTRQLDIVLGVLLAVVVGGAAFQLLLRYTYVHTAGNTVVRIDRLSGDTCTLPCNEAYGPVSEPYVPPASPQPEKVCHAADVVRVAGALRPPVTRTPTPYAQGGSHGSPRRHWPRTGVPRAVELSDGHIYAFAKQAYAADVANWSTGEEVQVCATWSRLEHRPYYSVGISGDADPAVLAL